MPYRPHIDLNSRSVRSSAWLSAAITLTINGGIIAPGHTNAAEFPPLDLAKVKFDTSMLSGHARGMDLSRFERGMAALPGQYEVDVYMNDAWQARAKIRLVESKSNSGQVRVCLSRAQLESWGVDAAGLEPVVESVVATASAAATSEDGSCLDVTLHIPGATVQFDSSELKLLVSVPQLYMRRTARGWVDPAQWSPGINAAMLSYDANAYHGIAAGRRQDTGHAALAAGVNWGPWQLRHRGSVNWGAALGRRYLSWGTFAQRDVTPLRSQLVLGQTQTAGTLFPSTGFTGVRLSSDDRMLPESMQGYAPVIRGVAQTAATVEIYQRGYLLFETPVAPGPFEIDDLFPSGYGGDLEVVVNEADGRELRFSVPFAAVPRLLRQGTQRYSLSAGRVRDIVLEKKPYMVEGTWQRGLTSNVTGYAGVLVSQDYRATLIGAAVNTPWGAMAGDITTARTAMPAEPSRDGRRFAGQSFRLSFSKFLQYSRTHLTLSAYCYSRDGYLDLTDAMRLQSSMKHGSIDGSFARQRSRTELTVSQDLGQSSGHFWANASQIEYWNREQRQVDFSAGYSAQWRGINLSLSVQRNRTSHWGGANDRVDTLHTLSLTVPLGTAMRRPNLSSTLTHQDERGVRLRTGLTYNPMDELNAGAWFHRDQVSGSTAADGQVNYRTSHAAFSGTASRGDDYYQFGVGIRGGAVFHREGVTLAQQLGDTVALVSASGAIGAQVGGATGVRVDRWGRAVLPYLSPYRMNEISLDPKGIPLEVELSSSKEQVAPRAGAVVALRFATQHGGRSALMTVVRHDGSPLPFGADVLDALGNPVGVVGQASRLWARGLEPKGQLTVQWGPQEAQHCSIDYQLPEVAASAAGPTPINAICMGLPEFP